MTLRVLHVSQPTEAGVARCVTDVVADQVNRGWRVTVAAPPTGPLARWVTEAGAEHARWDALRQPGPSVPEEARRLKSILSEHRPDLVHLHSSKAGLVGRLVLRGRRPTIFEPNGWSFVATGRLVGAATRSWERRALAWTDRVVCVSQDERVMAERLGLVGDLRVIPNAVDLEHFHPAGNQERQAIRQELGLDGSAPLAMCVGRLCRQKGQDVLLDAWPKVLASTPEAQLVLVGDGPWRAMLAGRASDRVRFVGAVGDVRPWLWAADTLVFPSRWEGMSLAVLESMACGRSVVVSDVIGMREAVGTDREAGGAVVPPEDPSALASTIARRLRDPELTNREGGYARDRMVRSHDLRWRVDSIAEVYAEVVASHDPTLHGAGRRAGTRRVPR